MTIDCKGSTSHTNHITNVGIVISNNTSNRLLDFQTPFMVNITIEQWHFPKTKW